MFIISFTFTVTPDVNSIITMMTTSTTKVAHFTNSTDYNAWLLEMLDTFLAAGKRAVSAADHARLYGIPKAPRLNHPGQRPALVADNDTAAARNVKVCALTVYAQDLALYEIQESEDIALKTAIKNGSPKEAIAAMSNGVTGTLRLTPETMLASLKITYGTVSATTFDSLGRNLPKSCGTSPAEVTDTANKLRQYFDVAQAIGQPISEAEKVSTFMKILPREFDFNIKLFKSTYKVLALRLFETLVLEMISVAEDISTMQSANAVVVQHPGPPNNWNEYIQAAIAAATAAGLQNPNTANIAATAPVAPEFTYCWSHGKCKKPSRPNVPEHTSLTCTKRHPNHVAAATMTNQMGGKKTVWVRFQPLGP